MYIFNIFSRFFSSRRRVAWAGAWLGAIALLAGTVPMLAQATSAAAATAAGCAHLVAYPHGPFKIAPDHRTVENANGTRFV